MARHPLRFAALCLLAAAALLAIGCGNKKDVVTEAETEGIYLDLGELKYQVQISRQLNPGDVQDREFFRGLPQGIGTELGPEQTWFGVFMRVQNTTEKPLRSADRFEIVDTQEKSYTPLALDPNVNLVVYRPTTLAPRTVFPLPDSAADQTFAQGGLLLFRLSMQSLGDRPLELKISDSRGSYEGVVNIDV